MYLYILKSCGLHVGEVTEVLFNRCTVFREVRLSSAEAEITANRIKEWKLERYIEFLWRDYKLRSTKFSTCPGKSKCRVQKKRKLKKKHEQKSDGMI